ncbi:MAG: protein translocase subunit SecF [Monoglobaceae bacterium]
MSCILKKKWIFMGISLVLMAASVLSLVIQGFNLDIDFAGGIAVTYEIKDGFETSDIENIVDTALGSNQSPASIQRSGENEVVIKFGYDNSLKTEKEYSDFSLNKVAAITNALQEKYDPENVGKPATAVSEDKDANTDNQAVDTNEQAAAADEQAVETNEQEAAADEQAADTNKQEAAADEQTADTNEQAAAPDVKVVLKSQDLISPTTGRDLARSALWMSILACLAILIYVTIRFEFTSGVVAVIALVHDVLILLGIYSIARISVDTNFIAAVLTVLGYSINNTIVIMDRIRENTRHARKESYAEIADKSILQTINRSINTTITTLLTIGMVYILGVSSIKQFALPIIIGIVIGFYSSVFDVGSLWATWKDAGVKSKKKA